jgi:hypothetical protein
MTVGSVDDPLLIMREGVQFGPYPLQDCRVMLMRRQLLPSDLAWQPGMAEWRPIGELFGPAPLPFPPVPPPVAAVSRPLPDIDDDETIGQVLGQMSLGCLMWIGVLLLAVGGGVVFPLLLLLLPFALIGGGMDVVKKIIRLVKRGQR